MIVLGIESATEVVGAAVSDGANRAAITVAGRRRHAETLAPAVAQVLERVGVQPGDLDAVAVDLGPGLFTGLRVGVATAKGLAQGLGIGVLGVTSLEILAAAAFDAGWSGSVLAVVDGRRGEVFAARYRRGECPGQLVELAAPARRRPGDLGAAGLDEDRPVLACGDGALRYRDQLAGLTVAGDTLASPDPGVLASLALTRIGSGVPLQPAADVVPVYLREADARINWAARAGVRGG